jgi:hypothetical protein
MSGKHALVIANTEYTDPGLAQLSTPGRDADDFARVLRDARLCAFDNVTVLLDQISSSAIEAIDGFFDDRKPDDLLVLYFSGHGIRDEFGSLYLAFGNTVRSRLRSTAIKSDYVREAMDQSRSKRQVIILDCCNSGAFPQGSKAELGSTMGMVQSLQGYGRFVLTASDATQFAWEGDQLIGQTENSLFTHFLVRGLEGDADLDGDGTISVDELYDYAFEQILKVTPKQTPTKSASRQEGEIVLRQIARLEDIKMVPLPDDLVAEIEDLRPYVRSVAVQKLERLVSGRNLGLARSAREALERMSAQDDSFQVRKEAGRVIAAIAAKDESGAVEQLSRDEAARAAALAAQKEEEERRARLTRTAELRRQQAEQATQFRAEQDRLLAENAELERQLRAEQERSEALVGPAAMPAGGAVESRSLPRAGWMPVLWLALSWTFAELLGAAVREEGSDTLAWLVTGLVGGLLTGTVLQAAGLTSRWRRVVWVVAGWAVAWGIGSDTYGSAWNAIYSLVKEPTGSDVAGSIAAALIAGVVGGFIGGTIGGLITALVLRQDSPGLSPSVVLWITLGWAAGWAAAWSINGVIGQLIYWSTLSTEFRVIVTGVISGALGGGIGGYIMLWQLGRRRSVAP